MTEENFENTDVNPVVEGEGVNQELAQPNSDISDKEMNFAAIRQTLDEIKQENAQIKAQNQEYQNMLSMYQSLGQQPPQQQNYQQNQPAQPKSAPIDFNEAVDSESFSKMFHYVHEKEQAFENQTKQMQQQLEEMRLINQDKNYMGTIKKYLPDALESNPSLRQIIESAENPKTVAYHFAVNSQKYIMDKMTQEQNQGAKEVVKNSRRPSTLGALNTNKTANTGEIDPMRLGDDDFYAERKRRFGI